MTQILAFTPPPSAPLWTADTVRLPFLSAMAPAAPSFRFAELARRIRTRLTDARLYVWAAVVWLWWRRPVVTTARRYQDAVDGAHTDGALWGIRHEQRKAVVADELAHRAAVAPKPNGFWEGRNGQMRILRGRLDEYGPESVIEEIRDWKPLTSANAARVDAIVAKAEYDARIAAGPQPTNRGGAR